MATDIAAYILQANGSVPGAQRLAPATTARIGEIGMRQTPPALATAQTPAPATAPASAGETVPGVRPAPSRPSRWASR